MFRKILILAMFALTSANASSETLRFDVTATVPSANFQVWIEKGKETVTTIDIEKISGLPQFLNLEVKMTGGESAIAVRAPYNIEFIGLASSEEYFVLLPYLAGAHETLPENEPVAIAERSDLENGAIHTVAFDVRHGGETDFTMPADTYKGALTLIFEAVS